MPSGERPRVVCIRQGSTRVTLLSVTLQVVPVLAVVGGIAYALIAMVAAHIVVTGEPPYANAKVYSLEHLAARARHPILVITDSDTSVSPQYLQAMARSFEPEEIGAVTNLYRGVGGTDVWSKLEALGM